jgi:nucleoside 2-deoxyribosyltransferase
MADKKHIEIALKGAEAIEAWKKKNPNGVLDLSDANLRRADLSRSNLSHANLKNANLEWADLRWADLVGADLSQARLDRADFHKADLNGAVLTNADLTMTNFEDANLSSAIFDQTIFGYTRLFNTDLSDAKGLEKSEYRNPSSADNETIDKSGTLPKIFLDHVAHKKAKAVLAGYQFEREVAAIYRALGAKVQVDVGLAGSQIDIVLKEQTSTGSEISVAVECKSTERPVGIQSVVAFASVAQLLKQRGLIDRATIVAKSGFSRQARQAANEYKIELLEFADLLQRADGKQIAVEEAEKEFEQQQSTREIDLKKRIFVVMPFSKEFEDVYFLGIREVSESLGFIVERADDIEHNESILEVICAKIAAADAIIGDTTGSNPNVFYEIGYAHALRSTTILIARKGSNLPFDLQGINHIMYETIVELRERLKKRLTSVFSIKNS